jgi:hypothetical protein
MGRQPRSKLPGRLDPPRDGSPRARPARCRRQVQLPALHRRHAPRGAGRAGPSARPCHPTARQPLHRGSEPPRGLRRPVRERPAGPDAGGEQLGHVAQLRRPVVCQPAVLHRRARGPQRHVLRRGPDHRRAGAVHLGAGARGRRRGAGRGHGQGQPAAAAGDLGLRARPDPVDRRARHRLLELGAGVDVPGQSLALRDGAGLGAAPPAIRQPYRLSTAAMEGHAGRRTGRLPGAHRHRRQAAPLPRGRRSAARPGLDADGDGRPLGSHAGARTHLDAGPAVRRRAAAGRPVLATARAPFCRAARCAARPGVARARTHARARRGPRLSQGDGRFAAGRHACARPGGPHHLREPGLLRDDRLQRRRTAGPPAALPLLAPRRHRAALARIRNHDERAVGAVGVRIERAAPRRARGHHHGLHRAADRRRRAPQRLDEFGGRHHRAEARRTAPAPERRAAAARPAAGEPGRDGFHAGARTEPAADGVEQLRQRGQGLCRTGQPAVAGQQPRRNRGAGPAQRRDRAAHPRLRATTHRPVPKTARWPRWWRTRWRCCRARCGCGRRAPRSALRSRCPPCVAIACCWNRCC